MWLTFDAFTVNYFWDFHLEIVGWDQYLLMVFMHWEYVWFIQKKSKSSFQVKEFANISKSYQKVSWLIKSKCHLEKTKTSSQCSGFFKSLTGIWCSHSKSFMKKIMVYGNICSLSFNLTNCKISSKNTKKLMMLKNNQKVLHNNLMDFFVFRPITIEISLHLFSKYLFSEWDSLI